MNAYSGVRAFDFQASPMKSTATIKRMSTDCQNVHTPISMHPFLTMLLSVYKTGAVSHILVVVVTVTSKQNDNELREKLVLSLEKELRL